MGAFFSKEQPQPLANAESPRALHSETVEALKARWEGSLLGREHQLQRQGDDKEQNKSAATGFSMKPPGKLGKSTFGQCERFLSTDSASTTTTSNSKGNKSGFVSVADAVLAAEGNTSGVSLFGARAVGGVLGATSAAPPAAPPNLPVVAKESPPDGRAA